MLLHEGEGIQVSGEHLFAAFDRIKQKPKLDHYGVSVAAIKLVANVAPNTVADVLTRTISSTPAMSTLFIKGRVYVW